MKFYVVGWRKGLPGEAEFPCIRLQSDGWDDFGSQTLFHVSYFPSADSHTVMGETKIMQESVDQTKLDPFFDKLDETYCSLGQSIDFYSKCREVLGEGAVAVLDALNDTAINHGLRDKFEKDRVFVNSLLRFSEAAKALQQGKRVVDGTDHKEPFNFSFSCLISKSGNPHVVQFDFNKQSTLPFRTIALVGKNGTGKTRYLASLASVLSGQRNPNLAASSFHPNRPPFGKVIAIAYSAFDQFDRPATTRAFSYRYCGLFDEHGLLSPTNLQRKFLNSLRQVVELKREMEWHHFVKSIIHEHVLEPYLSMIASEDFDSQTVPMASSGQTLILYVLTEIIASIREESLLLFDEPEMHLHPNATASFIRAIELLLQKYDSYAIVATHSPIIVQEIPSHSVFVFERVGDSPLIRKLDIESFGENLSTLTEHVFDTLENENTYMAVLTNLAQQHSYEEVLAMFQGRLSFNAKMFLKSKYGTTQA